jgi:hypothetical protein
MRVFALFISVSLGFEIYAIITSYYGINNMNALHIYTVVEYSFIAYFFSMLTIFEGIQKNILISIIVFSIGALYYSFFIADMIRFNSITRTTESILISILGLFYYYKFLEKEPDISLFRYPYFWINSGIVIYFLGNFVMSMTYETLISTKTAETTRDYWNAHSLLNIIANTFYFLAFLWSPRQPK